MSQPLLCSLHRAWAQGYSRHLPWEGGGWKLWDQWEPAQDQPSCAEASQAPAEGVQVPVDIVVHPEIFLSPAMLSLPRLPHLHPTAASKECWEQRVRVSRMLGMAHVPQAGSAQDALCPLLLLGMQLLLPTSSWAEGHWGVWVWWGQHCWGGGFGQQSSATILASVAWRGTEIKQRVHSSATSALMISWRPCIFGLLQTTGAPVIVFSMVDPKMRTSPSPLPASLWKLKAQNLIRLPRQFPFPCRAPVLQLSSAELSS